MPAKPPSTKEELLQQTIDRFWETIPPLWSRIRANLRSTAAEHFGITVEQFHILRHINRGMNSACELSAAIGISRPAVSQAVELLAHKGLITRQQDTSDRRYVTLALTKNGSTLLKGIFDNNRIWMLGKLDALSQAELSAAIHAMETLKKTINEKIVP
jgi:DNA-binding MarR family transcriptional regulator